MNTPRGARRTDTKLSDGRDLIYYDPADSPVRVPLEDTRGLPEPKPQVELRTDPLTGDVITYATHRNTRTYLPPADQCPLCATKPGNPTEIPDHDYNVAVFENRFPSFAGPGRAEVVCFTSDHNKSFTDLSQGQARLVVDAWADRTAELSARPDVEYVFPFENRGREIGVTLSHPHGQIYAFPFLPPRIKTLLARAREHQAVAGSNLFADILAAERKEGTRVVAENGNWTAFVPEAARWPVEVHLYPHRQVAGHRRAVDRGARRLRRALPRRPATVRRPVRRPAALHRRLAPGAGPGRPRAGLPAPGAVVDPAGRGQDQVPGRLGVRDGRVHLRHPAGGCGRDTAEGWFVSTFAEVFGTEPDGAWRAPGRVNLIGEHTDYNDGLVLPIALPNQIQVTASGAHDGVIAVASTGHAGVIEFALDSLAPGSVDDWAAYPAGAAWVLREAGYDDRRRQPAGGVRPAVGRRAVLVGRLAVRDRRCPAGTARHRGRSGRGRPARTARGEPVRRCAGRPDGPDGVDVLHRRARPVLRHPRDVDRPDPVRPGGRRSDAAGGRREGAAPARRRRVRRPPEELRAGRGRTRRTGAALDRVRRPGRRAGSAVG